MGSQTHRNYGIDLLRIGSMLLVVILHVLGQGGVLSEASQPLTARHYIAWSMEICAYCSVNIYALISGYVGWDHSVKPHKIVNLWTGIFFWSMLVTVLFRIFKPHLVPNDLFFNAVFFVSNKQLWYVTAYFGLFFFMPFLNAAAKGLSKPRFTALIIVCLVLFSIQPTLFGHEIYGLGYGYSFLWLAVMYMFGAYLKKYDIASKISKTTCVLAYIISAGATVAAKFIGEYYALKVAFTDPQPTSLINYISPTVVICAIAAVIFFSKLNIKNSAAVRLIAFFAPAAFGVYVIHVQPLIFANIIRGAFSPIGNIKIYLMPFAVLLAAVLILMICLILEKLRILLFRLTRADRIGELAEHGICAVYEKYLKKYFEK